MTLTLKENIAPNHTLQVSLNVPVWRRGGFTYPLLQCGAHRSHFIIELNDNCQGVHLYLYMPISCSYQSIKDGCKAQVSTSKKDTCSKCCIRKGTGKLLGLPGSHTVVYTEACASPAKTFWLSPSGIKTNVLSPLPPPPPKKTRKYTRQY